MVCRLIGTKPLSEPMLAFCWLGLSKQTSVKCYDNMAASSLAPCVALPPKAMLLTVGNLITLVLIHMDHTQFLKNRNHGHGEKKMVKFLSIFMPTTLVPLPAFTVIFPIYILDRGWHWSRGIGSLWLSYRPKYYWSWHKFLTVIGRWVGMGLCRHRARRLVMEIRGCKYHDEGIQWKHFLRYWCNMHRDGALLCFVLV